MLIKWIKVGRHLSTYSSEKLTLEYVNLKLSSTSSKIGELILQQSKTVN